MPRLHRLQAARKDQPDESPGGANLKARIWKALANKTTRDADDPLAVYIHQAGQTPRLKKAEQLLLGRALREHLEATSASSQAAANSLLLALRSHFHEHVRAMQDLACRHLRLAISLAARYQRSGVLIDDLIQAASLGLLAAAARFDERRVARFSTYATWWIQAAIHKEIDNCSAVIRLPAQVRAALRKLQECASRQCQPADRNPSLDELARQTGLDPDVACKILRTGAGMTFFSELEEAEYRSLINGRRDLRASSPLENAIQSDLKAFIGRVLRRSRKLNHRMRLVVKWRFGLDDGYERSCQEIGERLNLSADRVWQIQKQAIEHLRFSELKDLVERPPKNAKPVAG